ncbi:MAG: HAMP domain-containing histidine kinase [Bacteroidetes bacterium]|nr:HAMP domain-containing histidine kinase [Bacteroidota bacterium]MBT4409467.1 HAMP domain-containing histidine kinase [Bacteroidota bacterium]MBT7462597.1 HAMP domain-containing histidine kinase [Bacteroidota bacterium]
MHIYSRKQRWKIVLFIFALIIGIASTWYTNVLVQGLAQEERNKIEIWAQATHYLGNNDDGVESNPNIQFFFHIIQNNETIPVITVDENGEVKGARNVRLYDKDNKLIDGYSLSALSRKSQRYLDRQLQVMKDQHEPIVIQMPDAKQYLYYKDSVILTRIQFFPLLQLSVIFLFILVAYFAFNSSKSAEQNQVWVGMSKETAHQLGTPISSLMAWIELMKMKENDQRLLSEVEKDVHRLETIADRFSKIGSAPVLVPENLLVVLRQAVNYLENRSSNKIKFKLLFGEHDELFVPLNVSLFEWVVENLCRNAIDAMDGVGDISISVKDQGQVVYIDIADSGKGVPKTNYKVIFQPGYTTKQRGWGLGLSLVKRIVENYHSGKIFVKNSELNKGSTFRIVLKK